MIGPLVRLPYILNQDQRLLLSILLIVATALVASIFVIREVENRLLRTEASRAAVHWARFLQTRLRGLDEILAAGLISEDDRRTLDFAAAAGAVRDYQVIRPDGIVAMSSWSGDFRGVIEPATVLSVINNERIISHVVDDITAGQHITVGQAYVPLTSGTGRRGALKVDVDVTNQAARYRRLGNGAFAVLIALLAPPGGLCGWLIGRNMRERRRSELVQGQRGHVLEALAKNAPLNEVLQTIARFAEQHAKVERCVIVVLDPSGDRVSNLVLSSDDETHQPGKSGIEDLPPSWTAELRSDTATVEVDDAEGPVWSVPLRATTGALLGSFSLSFHGSGKAATAIEPGEVLAQLATLAIESRRAEDALLDMRQRHELILNAAGDGIFGVDEAARIIFANPAAARMLGRDVATMIGTDGAGLVEAETTKRGPSNSPVAATLRDGSGREIELAHLLRGDGSRFPAALVITPVSGRSSDLRAVVVFHDISSQIQARRELQTAKDEAELANRTKSSFLAHMSHELRTPLNAIIGFSQIMSEETLGPINNQKYREYADDICASGQYLLDLINDLLDLSKVEAGKMELALEPVKLPALMERSELFVSEVVREKSLTFRLVVEPDVPAVQCDPRKVQQVLVNLLSNAAKFTPAGGDITFSARRDGADHVSIEVADNGIGIAPEDMARAMTAFGQVEGGDFSHEQRGTGLGLPLSKAFVELHGGSLTLRSKPGEGTTATVRLPASATDSAT